MDPCQIECVRGDIAHQPDMDVVVNAANAQLLPGSGVAGAIHGAAGPELARACRPLAPIRPGQAVMTEAFGLPNRYVIHCLGPVYGVDRPEDRLLAECYRNALHLAEAARVSSIAFPAIATGVFGYPLADAAAVTAEVLRTERPALRHLRRIRLVLFSDSDRAVFQQALAAAGLIQVTDSVRSRHR